MKMITADTTLGQLRLALTQLGITDLHLSLQDDLVIAVLTHINPAESGVVIGKGSSVQEAIAHGVQQVQAVIVSNLYEEGALS
jgi:hypothetical protein